MEQTNQDMGARTMRSWIVGVLFVVTIGLAIVSPWRAKAVDNDSVFVVRDATTAVLLAEAVIQQEYGKDELKRLSPLTATKKSEKWVVRGDIDQSHPRKTRGGIVEVEIAVERGTILKIRYEI
jgi:hypothetical protein